jgi:hypothetical protein
MLLLLTLTTFIFVQDTTGYDHQSEKDYLRNINSPLRYRYTIDVLNKGLYIYDHQDGVIYNKINDSVAVIDTLNRKYIDNTTLHYDNIKQRLIFLDAGGGRVFEYDLLNKTLNRLDKSYRFRSFYGGKNYLYDMDRIFSYGGGGEFSSKDDLLYFNNSIRGEWEELVIDSKPSSDKQVLSLLLDKVTNSFYLFTISSDSQYLEIYAAKHKPDTEVNSEWKKIDRFTIKNGDKPATISNHNQFSNYNLIDRKFNILGKYFYNIDTSKLSRINTNKDYYGIFQSNSVDSLVLVENPFILPQEISKVTPFEFKFESYSIDDFFENQSFELIPSIRQQRIQLGLIVLVALIFFSLGVMLYRKQTYKNFSVNNPESSFNVVSSDNHIVVNIGSSTHYFYENLEIKILALIFEVTQKGLDTIELDVFDEKIFNGLSHKSHMTTKRNDALKRINKKLGFKFITKEKSQEDKRRKFVKISL